MFVRNEKEEISEMCCIGNDFHHNNFVNIDFRDNIKGVGNAKGIAKFGITKDNLKEACIYFSVRNCIEADWLNDRDQFLYPKNTWEDDIEFQNDCLAFTLFHPQNRISSEQGVNHWIPFTEVQLNAKDSFASHFMTDFI